MTETIYDQMVAETAFVLGAMARHPSAGTGTHKRILLRKGDEVLTGWLKPWETGRSVWA
jgi:hypothetical protein